MSRLVINRRLNKSYKPVWKGKEAVLGFVQTIRSAIPLSRADQKQFIDKLSVETQFSREELIELRRSFVKEFPRGFVSLDQFKQYYGMFFPSGDATHFAAHLFRTFDTNADGRMSFEEFATALSVMQRGSEEDKLSWAFRVYDVNGDGEVSLDEVSEIMGSLLKMSGEKERFVDDGRTPCERALAVFAQMCDGSDGSTISKESFLEKLTLNACSLQTVWNFL